MVSQVKVSHILVNKESEAKVVLAELQKGISFSKLAQEKSICPSGKRGGDLGFFTRGKMVKEFETAAFALKKSEISGLVKTRFGYHLIKKTDER